MEENNQEINWSHAELQDEINKILSFVDINDFKIISEWVLGHNFTMQHYCNKLDFILICACFNIKYPKMIIYLENFLKTCSVRILNMYPVLETKNTLAHLMIDLMFLISFEVFELLIKYGMQINNINRCDDTTLHYLCNIQYDFQYFLSRNSEHYESYVLKYSDLCILEEDLSEHMVKIIKLFVNDMNKISSSSCDLNYRNMNGDNVLDLFNYCPLNELNKHIIRTLLDYGAVLNKTDRTELVDFVDAYKYRNIKPAKK